MRIPKVAIITRTKDRPFFLERAIGSVLKQSFNDWVHVIVNDGGNASTVDLQIAFHREAYNDRVIVVHNEQSLGMQNASNSGLEASNSTYVVIHDDDDSWCPDFLETCVEFLEKEGDRSIVQGVVTQSTQIMEEICFDGKLQELEKKPYYPFEFISIEELRKRNMFAPIAFLYRREVHQKIGYFKQEFDVLGDHDFNIRFVCEFEMGVIETCHANYHWRYNSFGNTVTQNRNQHRRMLSRLKNAYSRRSLGDRGEKLPSLEAIGMPQPDGSESPSFQFRNTEPPWMGDFPDFLSKYNFKVLSLDVFDTVLRRKCHRPRDVFKILEKRAQKVPELKDFPIALAREMAESKARVVIHREVTLDDIYGVLMDTLGWESNLLDSLKNLELEIERELLYADPRWLELYKSYNKEGQRIIFVSDMYLNNLKIRELLEGCGFSDPEVFVSCDFKKGKYEGALQQIVTKKLGFEPNEILHVGDNLHSDCIMSQQAGWQTFHWSDEYLYQPWYSQVDPYFFSVKDLLSTRIMGEVRRQALTEGPCSLTEKLGREVAGPFYLSFMNWVLTEARKDNVRKIFLLGRDGYYWEKSIKILSPLKEFGVEVTYVHSSRKVLNFASFRTLDEEALSFLMVPNPSLTAKDFISRAGLDPELFLEKMEFVGFEDPEAILTSVAGGKFLDSKYPGKLRNLFMLLKSELEEKFAEDREGITGLLEEAGFDSKDCAIVDIGWNASCLKALSRLKMLKQPECMRGYFFGTWSAAAKGPQPIQFKSYFVHLGLPDSRAKLIRESVNWLESINAAPFATLSGFKKVDGNISPRFEKNGIEGFAIDQQEELWKGASIFLEGAVNIVGEDFGSEAGMMYLEAVLNRLLREPSPEEARAWGDILHSEGFGIAAYTPLISDVGEETYGEDLMKAYWSSNWRRGFLTLLPEDKRQFVLHRAKPGKKKTVEQLEADLLWRQKQVDSFWNEKEAYKEEISQLQETNAELNGQLEALKTDLNWKSGEAHALLKEKEVLRAKLESVQEKPHQSESN